MNGKRARREARKVEHRYRLLDESYYPYGRSKGHECRWQPPNKRWRNYLKRKNGGKHKKGPQLPEY